MSMTAVVAVVVGVVMSSLVGVAALASPASAYPASSVTIEGHGYGHGHGMGQWGALGYALDQTGYASILGTYYGGTSLAALTGPQDATTVRVDMTENDGNQVIVTSGTPFTVGGTAFGANQVALMVPNGGSWNLWSGPAGCAGPWQLLAQNVPTLLTASPSPDDGTQTLTLCLGGPDNVTMHGTITAEYNSNGAARTVNTVPLEQYVDGVVPNESPAGWGTLGGAGPQGQDWGFQELEAQAVAVRSYVMASPGSYGGYADTCDLACQTYRGTLNESAVTDLAAADTAGQVMEFPGGTIASTQYSASTGGYTNPGAFPGVPDAGDSVCVPGACNPNHDWTTSVPVSTIDATWPQLGVLQSISITGRNGDGDYGGRVTALTLIGSDQNVSLTGDAFAAALGLKSDWFTTATTLDSPAVAMARTPDGGGYWLAGADGAINAFGDAGFLGSADGSPLNRPVVGMAATHDGGGYWMVATDGGIFTYGDAAFYGSMGGRHLNLPIVGMAATPDGGGYWEVASDGGIFTFGDAGFYGSTGNIHLNQPVVGMATTPDGHGYWLVARDGGIFTFGDAAFYGSTGNIHLNQPVVGMAATSDGHGYWLVASDGGIFTFGDAGFHGSAGSLDLVRPVVGMTPTPDGNGYWLVASDGGIFTFGDAPFAGSGAG
jgi:SpoIID/LytB domain protein